MPIGEEASYRMIFFLLAGTHSAGNIYSMRFIVIYKSSYLFDLYAAALCLEIFWFISQT
jgi:hypothetical protein